jgi:hypothetical protein
METPGLVERAVLYLVMAMLLSGVVPFAAAANLESSRTVTQSVQVNSPLFLFIKRFFQTTVESTETRLILRWQPDVDRCIFP